MGERETEGVRERGREEGGRVGEGKRGRENQREVKGLEKVEREFEFEFFLQRLQIRRDASFHLAFNTEL